MTCKHGRHFCLECTEEANKIPTQLDRIEAKIDQLLAKKKPKPRASKKHDYDDKFEAIWEDYPKVEGANKSKSYACYQKRLSESNMPSYHEDYIHQCVNQYAALCEATDRKVMLPSTFFGIHKHYENDWTIPTVADNVPRDNDKLESFALEHGYRLAWSGETFTDWRKALEKIHRKENRNVQK